MLHTQGALEKNTENNGSILNKRGGGRGRQDKRENGKPKRGKN